jgi:hypothetical protein
MFEWLRGVSASGEVSRRHSASIYVSFAFGPMCQREEIERAVSTSALRRMLVLNPSIPAKCLEPFG